MALHLHPAVSRLSRIAARLAATVLVLAVLAGPTAFACAVCFGAADSSLLNAARAGVLVMVGITLLVLGGFARWFLMLRRLDAADAAGRVPLEGEQR